MERSTDGTPARPAKSISDAFHSARDFLDQNSRVPAVVRVRPRLADYRIGPAFAPYDKPKALFLRDQFARWFTRLVEDFAHLWPELKRQIPNLIALACDGTLCTPDWCAPGWLAHWQASPAKGTELPERLSVADTKKVVAELEDHARRSLQKTRPPVRRARRVTYHNPIKIKIALVKRVFPGVKAIGQICELLDRREVPIPADWKKAGKKSWMECWSDTSFRKKLKPYIAKIPPLARR